MRARGSSSPSVVMVIMERKSKKEKGRRKKGHTTETVAPPSRQGSGVVGGDAGYEPVCVHGACHEPSELLCPFFWCGAFCEIRVVS